MSERPVYLISDLHLEAGRRETTSLLLDFLSGPARRARALYILGDLFEAWVGDDGADELAATVASSLKAVNQSGTTVYFLHGNRDFLLGEDYCRRAGMQLLQEPVILPELHPPTALIHGDTLCTDDHDYQRFRRKVRAAAWQARVLSRPLWWRHLLARIARTTSKRRNRGKPPEIMDVNAEAVRDCFRNLGIRRLIHGHTHRPALHRLEVDGQQCERIVLGDWHDTVGSVLQIDADQARLMMLRRSGNAGLELVAAEAG